MQCPICARELVDTIIKGIKVEICNGGCGGVWFDWSEIIKIDKFTYSGDDFPVIRRDANHIMDQSRRYICPRCKNIAMTRGFTSIFTDLLLGECQSCGGFWLNGEDVDELQYHIAEYTRPESFKDTRQEHIAMALCFLCPGHLLVGNQ